MNQPIIRRLGIVLVALLVVVLIPIYIFAQEIPPIPHTLDKRDDCLACHEEGKLGSPQIPADHEGRSNDTCQACHKPAVATEAEEASESTPESEATESAEPTPEPESEETSEPAAGPPVIPHTLDKREDCLACHEEGKLGSPQIPADHEGRSNDICQACHKPAAAPEAEEVSEPTPESEATETAEPTPEPEPEETSEPAAGPPAIPHTLENRSDCLACHEEGNMGAPQIPADHEGRPNDICQACHQPVTAAASPAPTAEATGPAPVPHTLVGHENCLECHLSSEATPMREEGGSPATPVSEAGGAPVIPHPLIGREHCLACHEEGVGGAPQIPADHEGRTNDVCQACHQPSQLPAAPTPTTPSEPVPTPIVFPQTEEENSCEDCHLTLDDSRQVEITTRWQRSIHAERNVGCADCHGGNPADSTIDGAMSPEAGYIGVPAKADIPALCASCHADVTLMRQYGLPTDQWAQYQESTHGLQLAQGDTNVATCFDCHGGHQTLKANDPASTVYASNVPAMCADCHGDEALMAPYNLPTNQYDLYRQSIHGHALLDNQDFRAPNCATCHGTHGAAPPGFEEVANICGSCHSATQDYYLKSPHTGDGELTPRCITCHGHHEVSEPSEEMFVGADPRHCGDCHAADSEPGQIAKSLYDTISGAAAAYDEAESAIQVAQDVGMIVSPMEAKLREANTDLITARAVQHTVNVERVSEQTDSADAIAEEVQASAEAAVAESIFRRRAMVIAVAAIALTIVALYLLKRELDRRLESES